MYYNIPHQRNIVLLRSVTGNVYRVRGYESKQDSHEHTMLLTYSAEVVLYIYYYIFIPHFYFLPFTHAQVNNIVTFMVRINIFIAAAADSPR